MSKLDRQREGDFDGELFIAVDRALAKENTVLSSLISRDQDVRWVFGSEVLELLALFEEVRTLADEGADFDSIWFKTNEFNKLFSGLMEAGLIDRKGVEILLKGKVKVGLWVDSEGGDVELKDRIKWGIDALSARGAVVHSFVGVKAVSSAFDLAFLGDEVNCLAKTFFMWHFSDSEYISRVTRVQKFLSGEDLDEQAAEEIEELKNLFLSRIKGADLKQLTGNINRQFSNADNPEGNLVFEGRYLGVRGVVDNVYNKVNGLITNIQRRFPLHSITNVGMYTEGVVQRVCKVLAKMETWDNERALGATEVVIRKLEKVG